MMKLSRRRRREKKEGKEGGKREGRGRGGVEKKGNEGRMS
jgi:hypothetical protein